MALLIIEGDPGAIQHLEFELWERNYLTKEFNSIIIEAPEITDNWQDFIDNIEAFCHMFIPNS